MTQQEEQQEEKERKEHVDDDRMETKGHWDDDDDDDDANDVSMEMMRWDLSRESSKNGSDRSVGSKRRRGSIEKEESSSSSRPSSDNTTPDRKKAVGSRWFLGMSTNHLWSIDPPNKRQCVKKTTNPEVPATEKKKIASIKTLAKDEDCTKEIRLDKCVKIPRRRSRSSIEAIEYILRSICDSPVVSTPSTPGLLVRT